MAETVLTASRKITSSLVPVATGEGLCMVERISRFMCAWIAVHAARCLQNPPNDFSDTSKW